VTNVLIGGPPATKMLNMTIQNGINSVGLTLTPSQIILMMLR
jgi:hypothetical protein